MPWTPPTLGPGSIIGRAKRLGTALVLGCAGLASAQVSPQVCGSLTNAIGPWDYRTERGSPLQLVESAHFQPDHEFRTNGYSAKDLDYTLRAFPNHHRALISVDRYGTRMKSEKPLGLPRSVECYFERAVRWRPDDVVVRMLYAQLLYKRSRPDEARAHLEEATSAAGENPLTHYNIGLVYLEGKDFERAVERAHKAYALGMPRPELRDRLQAAGHWREPGTPAAAQPAASAAAGPRAAP